MATYDYLYLLDSEKSKVYFFIMVYREEKFPGNTWPKTSDKKIRKMTIIKANHRLVKNSYFPKIMTDSQYLDLYL